MIINSLPGVVCTIHALLDVILGGKMPYFPTLLKIIV